MFSAVVLISLLLTYTNFNPSSDKVLHVFIFNVCVVFDHYPAKLFAILGVTILLMGSAFYFTIILAFVFSKRDFGLMLTACGMGALHFYWDMRFVNVFAVDLYPQEGPGHPEPAINGTLTLSDADFELLAHHTQPYNDFIYGNIIWMIFHAYLIFHYDRARLGIKAVRLGYVAFATLVNTVGVFHQMAVLEYRDGQWDQGRELTFMQSIVSWLQRTFFFGAYGPFLLVLYRVTIPRDWRLSIILSLPAKGVPPRDDHVGLVSPERLVACAFHLLLVTFSITYLFINPVTNKSLFPLAAGFRTIEGVQTFAPAWILFSFLIMCAVILSSVRLYLERDSPPRAHERTRFKFLNSFFASSLRHYLAAILGIAFCLNLVFCIWIVVPEIPWAEHLMNPVMVLFPIWLLCAVDHSWQTILYLFVMFCFAIASPFHWAPSLVVLLLLNFYALALPTQNPLYISISSRNSQPFFD